MIFGGLCVVILRKITVTHVLHTNTVFVVVVVISISGSYCNTLNLFGIKKPKKVID